MTRQKTAVVAEAMFDGDKLYQLRARQVLPLLVRHALAQTNVEYGPLSKEMGMPNARNLNYVLGSVGITLERLSQKWGRPIPPIQSLAVSKNSGLPGMGFFEGFTKIESPTRQNRMAILNEYYGKIYAYSDWLKVLEALDLKPAELKGAEEVEKARLGRGGEGEFHKKLKERIYNNPHLAECPSKPTSRKMEYKLPSGDSLDVYFEHGRSQFAVEVKPSTSSPGDIARGLFQCVKYEIILMKWRAWESTQADIRVILALGGELPESLQGLRNVLQVEVVEKIDER
ncbi:hypothetical protein [uncultured Rubinisphaera sp.]|uniref:hypothetical protein n=1 Tax=uncultured Rubinisphaera sp. TaxID=1678686 RepID=UPI0030D95906